MWRTITSRGRRFRVDRGVFNPKTHFSGLALAEHIGDLVPAEARVLEIGVGCGVVSAALAEHAATVVATDIDPRACRCAQRNLEDLDVDVRCGDLFEPVFGQRFDLVVANPPYEVGPSADLSLGSPDFLERFGAGVMRFTDRVALAYPADDEELLTTTSRLDLILFRRVPTRGRDLGVFVNSV